jgi:hypothetical protein
MNRTISFHVSTDQHKKNKYNYIDVVQRSDLMGETITVYVDGTSIINTVQHNWLGRFVYWVERFFTRQTIKPKIISKR